ncbi:sigma-70 family RNA polymerase sigma factor [Nocardia sp. NPDC051832]|uniref:sigma-70 family RNA polymerase sigma factor n=1 Tax=Nocardia sp. NPDC051832 TaxID=3155673 RepID=UPI00344340FD
MREKVTVESDGLREFPAHRPRLFALAYRLLGSASAAEEAVQETALRWNGVGRSTIRSVETWLTSTVVNLCRTRLVSERVRRAEYPGPWLPEPVPTARGELGPLESAEEREQVSLALLSALERLEPVERAVYVLREGFGYAHREIADMLAVTEATAQQSYRRARQRVREVKGRFTIPGDDPRAPIERLLKAARAGDIDELERMLAAGVVLTIDSGGRDGVVAEAGSVAHYLAGLFGSETPGREVGLEEVNGVLAVVARVRREPVLVLDIEAAADIVHSVRVVVSPGKLAYFTRLTC